MTTALYETLSTADEARCLAVALRKMATEASGDHDARCWERHRGCAMKRAAEVLEGQ